MSTSIRYFIHFIIFLLFALILFSCQSGNQSAQLRYSLFVMTADQQQYLWQTDNLDSGTVNPIQQGALLNSPPRIWYYMLARNGYYYYVDTKTEYLVKGAVRQQAFLKLDSIHLAGFSYSDNALFLDDDNLFIVNHSVGRKKKRYARVDIRTMEAHVADLPLDTPQMPFDNMSVGFVYNRGESLFIGYTYHYTNKQMGFGSADTVYVAKLSYPDMKLQHVDKDARSTYPGNVNTAQQNTFVDEQGNFYFMSSPGIARGANLDQPTAVYRMQAAEDNIDTNFFYNVSTAIGNHAYGLWYLGNNKALVRSERKDLFKTFKDHYLVPHIEYYEIDLDDPTQVYKLPLPLDRGTSRTCVLQVGQKTYITINDGHGHNDVWCYTSDTRSLTRALQLSGPIDYIFRLDRLRAE